MKSKKKRKNRSSGDNTERIRSSKAVKTGGPAEGVDKDKDISVSEILSQVNATLYVCDSEDNSENNSNDSVFSSPSNLVTSDVNQDKMASAQTGNSEPKQSVEPTNGELMACLRNIEGKLSTMDKRLNALEEVKEKVNKFDTEIKKLWIALEDRNKKVEQRVEVVEQKVDSSDFAVGMLNDRVLTLEKEKEELTEEVVYLQAQSMRNNLIFSKIPESEAETSTETETKVRDFIVEKMKVAKETVDRMTMERVHRIGPKQDGRCRNIVAKFLNYKDKEYVRKQWKTLQGTQYYVSEQFPKSVIDKRRKLIPRMKAAKDEGKRAWIAFDTLYIDGKAVKD